MIKYCPILIVKEEMKAVLVGQGDYTVQKMRPCIKEKCIAYYKWHCSEKGYCLKYENLVEIDSEVKE